jgi:hypothetical protein
MSVLPQEQRTLPRRQDLFAIFNKSAPGITLRRAQFLRLYSVQDCPLGERT